MWVRRRPRRGGRPCGDAAYAPVRARSWLVGAHTVRSCGFVAQNMFHNASAFDRPVAAWDVSKVTTMQVCSDTCGAGGECGQGGRLKRTSREGFHARTCVLARHRVCSPTRAFSISPWRRGMLVGSLTCTLLSPTPAISISPWRRGASARSRPYRVCSCTRLLSISSWMLGTLDESPKCGKRSPLRARSTNPWLLGTLPRPPRCKLCSNTRGPSISLWMRGRSGRFQI